jgi:ACS family glucarate transporter-like MFS transporter
MAICLDMGGKYAGAVTGAMNTAAYLAAFASSVIFGQLVTRFGNYTTPFIPMIAFMALGAGLILRVDASEAVIPERVAEAVA